MSPLREFRPLMLAFTAYHSLAVGVFVASAPAPKSEPPAVKLDFPCGEWICEWGSLRQGMTFHADGRYDSPEYGKGFWRIEGGTIWFSEGGDQHKYLMQLDDMLEGDGFCGHEMPTWTVPVKLRRK